jgi:hypothetical protein
MGSEYFKSRSGAISPSSLSTGLVSRSPLNADWAITAYSLFSMLMAFGMTQVPCEHTKQSRKITACIGIRTFER